MDEIVTLMEMLVAKLPIPNERGLRRASSVYY